MQRLSPPPPPPPRKIHTAVDFSTSGLNLVLRIVDVRFSPPRKNLQTCSRWRRENCREREIGTQRFAAFPRPDVRNEGNPNGPCPAQHNLLRTLAQATAACCAFAQGVCPRASRPAPRRQHLRSLRGERVQLIDEDLPLHNFKSVSLFRRPRILCLPPAAARGCAADDRAVLARVACGHRRGGDHAAEHRRHRARVHGPVESVAIGACCP